MNELVAITLENEMDIILVHKKALKLAERLGLTTSTQTTFATAASEVCREIIDKTDEGTLQLHVVKEDVRYVLVAAIAFANDVVFTKSSDGYLQAQKLVPQIVIDKGNALTTVQLKLGLPRNSKIDAAKLIRIKKLFAEEEPYTPYEEIKRKNSDLNRIAGNMDVELKQSRHFHEQKDEFISIASHELKTPVTIIKAFAQLALAKKDQCGDDIKGFLKKIDVQAGKIQSLIQQLLDISKIESGHIEYKMETLETGALLSEIIDLNRHVVPGNPIVADVQAHAYIKADKLRIEQVLSNIIGNAAKYSTPGTEIHVGARVVQNDFVIVVKDEGIGISTDQLENIFGKFYRSDEVLTKYSGLGMGLYIASRIIANHNGHIKAQSEEGNGSTFTITLPVVANV